VPLITQAPKAAITVAIQELSHKLVGSEPEAGEEDDDKNKKSWLNFLSKSEK